MFETWPVRTIQGKQGLDQSLARRVHDNANRRDTRLEMTDYMRSPKLSLYSRLTFSASAPEIRLCTILPGQYGVSELFRS